MKRYFEWKVDFRSKWVTASGILMGCAFFARMVYYFAFPKLPEVGTEELVFSLILPLLFWAGYTVLLNCIHWNAPGLYGIFSAMIMVLLMLETFGSGSVLQIVLWVMGYLLLGTLLVFFSGGYLPDKVLVVVPMLIAVVLKVLGISMEGGLLQALPELSSTAVLLAMLCLPMCMKQVQK